MGPMFVGVVENKMILLFGEIILFDYFGDYYAVKKDTLERATFAFVVLLTLPNNPIC